jgi:membrane protein YqaA with SNARE-associated domain
VGGNIFVDSKMFVVNLSISRSTEFIFGILFFEKLKVLIKVGCTYCAFIEMNVCTYLESVCVSRSLKLRSVLVTALEFSW